MTLLVRLIAAVAAFLALQPVTAASTRDWSQVAARTAAGAMIQGNPQAPVKLIEYLSFTCPHCAHFEAEAAAPLVQKYIKPGLVSYEVRIALRDPFDLVAAVLARCEGPRGFFAVKPALYAAQGDWLEKGATWGTTAPDLSKVSEADAGRAVAKGSGLDVFFAAHGLPAARANACLADTAAQKALSASAKTIWDIPGFKGTPAFEINGTMTPQVGEWPELDRLLAAAVAKSGHH